MEQTLECGCVVSNGRVIEPCSTHGGRPVHSPIKKPRETYHTLGQGSGHDQGSEPWGARHERAVCGCGRRFYLVPADGAAVQDENRQREAAYQTWGLGKNGMREKPDLSILDLALKVHRREITPEQAVELFEHKKGSGNGQVKKQVQKFPCPDCPMAFTAKQNLAVHQFSVHHYTLQKPESLP